MAGLAPGHLRFYGNFIQLQQLARITSHAVG
jgi:hypothetical protein